MLQTLVGLMVGCWTDSGGQLAAQMKMGRGLEESDAVFATASARATHRQPNKRIESVKVVDWYLVGRDSNQNVSSKFDHTLTLCFLSPSTSLPFLLTSTVSIYPKNHFTINI